MNDTSNQEKQQPQNQEPQGPATADYFGGCPKCGRNDGYLDVSRDHWMVCHEHKVRWYIGSNLFSSWRYKSESELIANWERIKDYLDIASMDIPWGSYTIPGHVVIPLSRWLRLAAHRQMSWDPENPEQRVGNIFKHFGIAENEEMQMVSLGIADPEQETEVAKRMAAQEPELLCCVICGGEVWSETPILSGRAQRDIHVHCAEDAMAEFRKSYNRAVDRFGKEVRS